MGQQTTYILNLYPIAKFQKLFKFIADIVSKINSIKINFS